MRKMFAPSPAELLRVSLDRTGEPDFGVSLSDGVYERGVYISAVRAGGPAARAGLLPFDRVMQVRCAFKCNSIFLLASCQLMMVFRAQVNERKIKEMECCDVVPLIARCGDSLSLVVSRNPLAESLFNDLDDDVSSCMDTASAILDAKMV